MAGYFAIFLVALTIGSGLIWLFDAVVLAPKRKLKLAQAEVAAGAPLTDDVKQQIAPQSYIAETCSAQFHRAFSNCTERHATKILCFAQRIP